MRNSLLAFSMIIAVCAYTPAHAQDGEIKALKEQYKSSAQQENKAFIEQQKAARQNFVEERKAKRQAFKSDVKSVHEGNVAERQQKRQGRRAARAGK